MSETQVPAGSGGDAGTAVRSKALTESTDISGREDIHKLRKHAVGLPGVLFLTLTGAAPISAMLFNVPIAVGLGQGVGAPAAFLVATIVLVIFSVGYVAMAREKTTAGGFYSYISYGLGRVVGIGTGYGAVLAYSVFEAALAGGFAYFLNAKLAQFGVNIGWPWLALLMVVLISALTFFDVRLSTVVLAAGLITEVIMLVVFDIAMFAHGHIPMAAINPVNAFKGLEGFKSGGTVIAAGGIGLGLFFAFWSWVGFEMAPNYGEESKDPKRNVPRALYISVIGLGIFYTLTSWAPFAAYPDIKAAALQASSNGSNYYIGAANSIGANWIGSILSYLIITGSFACGMAFHNTTARYAYSLGREGLLPRALGRTHHTYKSPHIASLAQSVIAVLIVLAFWALAGGNDPGKQAYIQVYGLLSVMGVIIILAIQALVSLSIFIYFEQHPDRQPHWWKTRVAPLVALVSQVVVIWLLFTNMGVIASGYSYIYALAALDVAVVVIGIGYALYLRSRNPAKYESAGRLINEGL